MSETTLDAFASLLTRSRNGNGALFLLVGESGVGKTYQIQSRLGLNAEARDLLIATRGRPQTDIPFYPLYEGIAEYVGGNLKSKYLGQLVREYSLLLPQLGSSLGALFYKENQPHLTSYNKETPLSCPHLLHFLRKLARNRLLIMWIDDFQWADAESILFVHYLQRHILHERMLWILCVNPRRQRPQTAETIEGLIAEGRRSEGAGVSVCDLRPYSRSEMDLLLRSILSHVVVMDSSSLDALFEKSRGVPYIVRVFLNLLLDRGILRFDGDTYHLATPIHTLSLPDTLRAALAARLKTLYRLIPEARDILEVASVIGERFEESTLEVVFNLCNAFRLLSTVEEDHELVHNVLRERQWEFEHVTVRDFIYDSLGSHAEQFHLRLARFLSMTDSDDYSQIAYHFKLAGQEEKSIEYKVRYGEALIAQGNFTGAGRLFAELWNRPSFFQSDVYQRRAFAIENARALAFFYLALYEECLQAIEDIRRRLPAHAAEPELLLLRCRCLDKANVYHRFEEARVLLETLRSALSADHRTLLRGRICSELVVCYSHLNAFEKARLNFEEARRLIEPQIEPIEHARLMRKAVLFYESELAVPILIEAAAVLRKYRVDHEVIMTINNLATGYIALGKLDHAADSLAEAISSSVSFDSFRLDYLVCNRGIVNFLRHQLDDALKDFGDAFQYATRGVTRIIIQNNIAGTMLALGRTTSAVDLLRVLLAEAHLVGEHVYITSITLNLARCHFVAGRQLDALLLLAAANVTQLSAFSSSYGEERAMLLRLFLRGLSCVADGDDTFESVSKVIRQDPHLIDMQFWGD